MNLVKNGLAAAALVAAVARAVATVATLENDAIEQLRRHGWRPDYISLRHRQTLQPASAEASEGVIVAAARLGTTRLIDNIEV